MSGVLKILFCFIFVTSMTGSRLLSSPMFLQSKCEICLNTPSSDIPHGDDNGENTPCESEESEKEQKEVFLTEKLQVYFSHYCTKYYHFQQIRLLSPFQKTVTSPPEFFSVA